MQMDLTIDECTLLEELLDRSYRDLKEEINKTEAHDFKLELKRREALLRSLQDKVRSSNVARAS